MEAKEREGAKERQREHGGTAPGRNTCGHLTTSAEAGKTRDMLAKKAGLGSGMTMRRVKKVVESGIPADQPEYRPPTTPVERR